jgi:NAD+ synthase
MAPDETATAGGTTAAPPFELPTELAIDTDVARRVIGGFIRGQLEQAGFERAVLGLSGGIDSALVAYLVAEAIGAERLLAVLMPYRTSSPTSRADAESVVADLGCASELVDITAMVDGYFGADGSAGTPGATGASGSEHEPASPLRRGNFAARMRMAVLYDRSVTWGGLVVGTGNKTESLIGYTTLFGDSACAFNPIGDLYKSQVRQVAVAIGVPDAIVRKAPSADLWPGQTDESEGGFSYPLLDRILFWRVDKRRSLDEMVDLGFDVATVERVDRLVATSEFKRQVPPIAKLGPRTAGVDYLYPRRRPGSARG